MLIILSASALCCGCSTKGNDPTGGEQVQRATITLSRLRELCEVAPFTSESDLICEVVIIGGGTSLNYATSIYVKDE